MYLHICFGQGNYFKHKNFQKHPNILKITLLVEYRRNKKSGHKRQSHTNRLLYAMNIRMKAILPYDIRHLSSGASV